MKYNEDIKRLHTIQKCREKRNLSKRYDHKKLIEKDKHNLDVPDAVEALIGLESTNKETNLFENELEEITIVNGKKRMDSMNVKCN